MARLARFKVNGVVSWERWEGSEGARWERWESSEVARWEGWEILCSWMTIFEII